MRLTRRTSRPRGPRGRPSQHRSACLRRRRGRSGPLPRQRKTHRRKWVVPQRLRGMWRAAPRASKGGAGTTAKHSLGRRDETVPCWSSWWVRPARSEVPHAQSLGQAIANQPSPSLRRATASISSLCDRSMPMPDLHGRRISRDQGLGRQALRAQECRRRLFVHLPGLAESVARHRAPHLQTPAQVARRSSRGGATRWRACDRSQLAKSRQACGTAPAGPSLDERGRPGRLVDEREARRRAGLLGRQAVSRGRAICSRHGLVSTTCRWTANCGSPARRSSGRSASSAGRTRATCGKTCCSSSSTRRPLRRPVRGAAAGDPRRRPGNSGSPGPHPGPDGLPRRGSFAGGTGPDRSARRRRADAAAAGLAL